MRNRWACYSGSSVSQELKYSEHHFFRTSLVHKLVCADNVCTIPFHRQLSVVQGLEEIKRHDPCYDVIKKHVSEVRPCLSSHLSLKSSGL